jgi:hypothetical protein
LEGGETLGLFEGGRKIAQRAMTGQSKDDVIAERIFDFFSSKGFPSQKEVSRIGASGWRTSGSGIGGSLGGTIGDLSRAVGPQRVKIEFILVTKEGGFLGKGKESKKFEFNLNADEYIDDGLRVKDEAAFQKVLKGYLKTLGFPSD